MTQVEQWLAEQEQRISEVSRQIDEALDLETDDAQRETLKKIKQAASFRWNYAVNRLDGETRQYILALVRGKR